MDSTFANSKTEGSAVASALDLYFRGLSLREVSGHLLSVWHLKVSHVTVMNWIRKYVVLASAALEGQVSLSSERWNVDETYVNLKGRHILFWNLLDEKTRFLIAVRVSQRRNVVEATKIVLEGIRRAGEPEEVVTDGAAPYDVALRSTLKRPAIHIQGPGLVGPATNNRVERLNGVMKKRLHVIGSFRTIESARNFANGYAIHHNYVKPHRAFGGKTPAEVAGITVEGENKWMTLIQNAGKKSNGRDS